jgi:hypothetical protein
MLPFSRGHLAMGAGPLPDRGGFWFGDVELKRAAVSGSSRDKNCICASLVLDSQEQRYGTVTVTVKMLIELSMAFFFVYRHHDLALVIHATKPSTAQCMLSVPAPSRSACCWLRAAACPWPTGAEMEDSYCAERPRQKQGHNL